MDTSWLRPPPPSTKLSHAARAVSSASADFAGWPGRHGRAGPVGAACTPISHRPRPPSRQYRNIAEAAAPEATRRLSARAVGRRRRPMAVNRHREHQRPASRKNLRKTCCRVCRRQPEYRSHAPDGPRRMPPLRRRAIITSARPPASRVISDRASCANPRRHLIPISLYASGARFMFLPADIGADGGRNPMPSRPAMQVIATFIITAERYASIITMSNLKSSGAGGF